MPRSAAASATPPSMLTGLPPANVMAEACPSRTILNHITSRWGVLVLIALLPGTQRFSELRRAIGGVSERMLAQTLQLLTQDGLIERHAHDVVPPHVDYRLTDLGQTAALKVRDLAQWIEHNLPALLPAADTSATDTPAPDASANDAPASGTRARN